MKIMSVVGARPNFMKIAPFVREIGKKALGAGHEGSRGQPPSLRGSPRRSASYAGQDGEPWWTVDSKRDEGVSSKLASGDRGQETGDIHATPKTTQDKGGSQGPGRQEGRENVSRKVLASRTGFGSAKDRQGGGGIEHCLVHTGQHYDAAMSESFFTQLGIPKPDVDLGIGSGSHAEQVGRTMIAFEKVVREKKPDWIVVVGDVNATCACSIVAKKEHVMLAHIEAGLRSRDRSMPEEINRIVTDSLADLLFTTDEFAGQNLRNEGVPEEKIVFAGNIMIDTLEANRQKAKSLDLGNIISASLRENPRFPFQVSGFRSQPFCLLTLHRPSNVDSREVLAPIVHYLIDELSAEMPLVWTLHPRTRKQLELFGLWNDVVNCDRITLLGPVGYLEMLKLNMEAGIMLTDSGGLQEECCVLGTPCITLRENTERWITLEENGGVVCLVGNDIGKIRMAFSDLKNSSKRVFRPAMWDGKAAERIVDVLLGSR